MAERIETQDRLLEAACKVFADKGYREATVQEICTEAAANVAAVNYYFRSKRQLYLAVWERVYAHAMEFFDTADRGKRSPRERLIDLIRLRVGQLFSTEAPALLRMIIHREMAHHSEVHEEIVTRFVRPGVARLIALVREVLGSDMDEATVARCAFSVHAHLVSMSLARLPVCDMGSLFGDGLLNSTHQEMETHAITFLMAGIDEVAARATDTTSEGTHS
jgi:AcrR family transcriptional regulator